jgi:hypothetical protein
MIPKLAVTLLVVSSVFAESLWTSATLPATASASDTAAVNLGLRFTSDVAGTVTGVRFYKGSRNTGAHVGALWSAAGTQLASVTFTNETATGWQQANFSLPVAITANTVYVVSYKAPVGGYAVTVPYTWSGVNSLPLRVSGTSPGVYTYSTATVFPTSTWNSSNYFVDVVFAPTPAPPPTPTGTHAISGKITGSAATVTLSGEKGAITTTDASGNYSFTGLPAGIYAVAPSAPGFTFNPPTVSMTLGQTNFTAIANPVPVPHSVGLLWEPSMTTTVTGYNVYRAVIAGGAFTKLNSTPILGTAYTDGAVESGRTYYYAVRAVDPTGESANSNQAAAVVPSP